MMETLTWRRGETRHFNMTFRGEGGVPTGSHYAAVQMQIRVGTGDILIDAVPGIFADAQGFAAGWSVPLNAQTLAAAQLGLAQVLLWGLPVGAGADGWVCLSEDYALNIKWGR